MSWLTESISEHSIAWLVASGVVGGGITAAFRFAFEDVLRPEVAVRRETRAVVGRYRAPLVRSAEALERRINNLVRNADRRWFHDDDYYRLSTLYAFGEHLGWIRIVERRFGFLPFESTKEGKAFNRHLNGTFRALTSFAYFRDLDSAAVEASVVPRLMLTAIGEVMIEEDGERTIEFTAFALRYAQDPQLRRWFADLATVLERADADHPLCWDRLILAGAQLRALVRFLDPKGALVPSRELANLDLLRTPGVADAVRAELGATPAGPRALRGGRPPAAGVGASPPAPTAPETSRTPAVGRARLRRR